MCLDGRAAAVVDTDPEPDAIVYELTKPTSDGRTSIQMSAFDLLDRLAALIVPTRTRRHSYEGVLSPHNRLRPKVIESAAPAGVVAMQITEAGEKMGIEADADTSVGRRDHPKTHKARRRFLVMWALLLARLCDVLPLLCPAGARKCAC